MDSPPLHADACDLPPLTAAGVHVWRLPWAGQRSQRDATLAAALQRYLSGVTATIARADSGRPYVPGAPGDLHFGVSHTGEVLLLAVARRPCGVDVERSGRRRRYREIAAQYFAPEELAWLDAASPADVEARFLALWVAKEALLKANGMGIAGGLRQLCLDTRHAPPTVLRVPPAFAPAQAWCVRWFAPQDGTIAAVATPGVCGELVLVDGRGDV